MRRIMYIIIVASLFAVGCTKDNFIDTGVSNGRHEGKSLLEYMEAHPYDWSFTVEMVRHAGEEMVRLFEGKDEAHLEITFSETGIASVFGYMPTGVQLIKISCAPIMSVSKQE